MRPPLLAMLVALLAAAACAQAPNDACANAIAISVGVTVSGANVGATTGPEPVACTATNDVWYSITLPCSGQYLVSTCNPGTSYDTTLSVWNGAAGCGALTLIGCNDNNCAVGGQTFASRVTFTGAAGALCYVAVGGKGTTTGPFSLRVELITTMTLAFTNLGPGTLGYQVTGPSLGTYFLAVSLTAGSFPFGWFFGIDLPLTDIVALFNAGPPFVGTLSLCGQASFGPIGGVPSGLTVYAVAIGFLPGAQVPGFTSNPTSTTVP